MRLAPVREPDDAHQAQGRSTADLLCLGYQLRTARKAPQVSQEQRQIRLEKLRQAIANGTYRVDSSALSKAIIRRELL